MLRSVKSALLLIAKQGYQDIELQGTRDALVAAGFDVVLGSTETGECIGKFDGREQATVALRDIDSAQYDRIAFIGGPGASNLWKNEDALRVAHDAAAAGKPFGAICIAPTILAVAGVLRGKRATVWNEDGQQQAFLEDQGATYTGEPVTVDGNIVTANGPGAAEEFGKTLASL